VVGFGLIAAGDFWLSTTTASNLSYAPIIPGLALVGIGFAFAVSAVTSVAVNAVPVGLAGMASGATSLLRDFGFTLGPAIIGAVALSRAATTISQRVASDPTLQKALNAFYAAPAKAPAADRPAVAAAVGAVRSGPLGANAVPPTTPTGQPLNPLHDVAFHALDHAYKTGYVICGGAAALSFLLAGVALGGIRDSEEPVPEPNPPASGSPGAAPV
jgi:hypothetical protein